MARLRKAMLQVSRAADLVPPEWLRTKVRISDISGSLPESLRTKVAILPIDLIDAQVSDELFDNEVVALRMLIEEGDEVWKFSSPIEIFGVLRGLYYEEGICLIRNGKVVASLVQKRMMS